MNNEIYKNNDTSKHSDSITYEIFNMQILKLGNKLITLLILSVFEYEILIFYHYSLQ